MELEIRHPEVHAKLIGKDGNAFIVLGEVLASLQEAGVDAAEVEEFINDATSGDYDHLIRTVMKWVTVE
jgi:hypothetical protein